MKKNIVYEAADLLLKQMNILQKANDTELEKEATRMDSMAKGAGGISDLADKQVKLYFATGFLPEENILVDAENTKLANMATKHQPKRKKTGLLIDEFERK